MKRERKEGRSRKARREVEWEGVMVKGASGVVGLQFAPNSKEELQTEEKDQWALMISLPATPRDSDFSGVRGCHGDEYSWLNKAYGERYSKKERKCQQQVAICLTNAQTCMSESPSETKTIQWTSRLRKIKCICLLFLLLPAL